MLGNLSGVLPGSRPLPRLEVIANIGNGQARLTSPRRRRPALLMASDSRAEDGREGRAMSTVVVDMSMSLDGFAAGANVRAEEPMGDGGEALHAWMAGTGPDAQIDSDVCRSADENVGAAVIGRRTFELGVGPWGGTPWPGLPSFVVTHRPRPDLLADNGGTFAFDSLDAALTRAKQAAAGGDVWILGVDVARQALAAGMVEEIRLHLVPILLGGGTRLFDGEHVRLIPVRKPVTGAATHLHLRVAPA
jgi:dihydrofolate reductase